MGGGANQPSVELVSKSLKLIFSHPILCTSQFQNRKTPPPLPPAMPGHLTRVKLRTVGNLTQNEARPVGHLTFLSKRLSAVGNKRGFARGDGRFWN